MAVIPPTLVGGSVADREPVWLGTACIALVEIVCAAFGWHLSDDWVVPVGGLVALVLTGIVGFLVRNKVTSPYTAKVEQWAGHYLPELIQRVDALEQLRGTTTATDLDKLAEQLAGKLPGIAGPISNLVALLEQLVTTPPAIPAPAAPTTVVVAPPALAPTAPQDGADGSGGTSPPEPSPQGGTGDTGGQESTAEYETGRPAPDWYAQGGSVPAVMWTADAPTDLPLSLRPVLPPSPGFGGMPVPNVVAARPKPNPGPAATLRRRT